MRTIAHLRRAGALLALLALLILLRAPAWGQAGGFRETFDDPALPEWEHSAGVAVVNGALQIEANNFAFHGGELQDGTLSVRARVQGEGDAVFSLRVSDTGSYHVVVVGGNALSLQREAAGEGLSELGNVPLPAPLGAEWFSLTVVLRGPTINVALNGAPLLQADDPSPLPPGGVAFEALGAATLEVDEVGWEGGGEPMPPAEPAEPAQPAEPTPPAQAAPALQAPVAPPQDYRPGAWVRTGGPLGGLGYDIRMRPDNPDVLYVTDSWAGVFMSTDGGRTWFPSNNGITARASFSGDAIPIFCLTIDPHNPNIIWAGTQNVRGIFKSTDGGQSWMEMDNGVTEKALTLRGFTVDPRSSDIVYAAAEISSWEWAGQEHFGREFDMVKGVVYKTTDGGQSWQAIWRGDNLARYVWIDPRDPNVIYVSTGIFDREAANSDPASGTPGGVGVLKSTDGGQTWQQINNGLGNLYVGSLFMHPTNPDILLAGTGNNQYREGGGVYLTTDGGQSWQYVLQNHNINSVEFATSDPNIAYAGGSDAVFRSEDGGHTWQQVSGGNDGWGPPGVRAGFPIDFQVDPRDANRIFANNYGGGNFLSEDGGRTWQVASAGYTGAQVRDIAVDPHDPARVYAAARSGIFVSADGGATWQGLSTPPARVLEWYALGVDPSNSAHVLAANDWQGVILNSVTGGQEWNFTNGGKLGGGQSWLAFAFAPSDPQTVYAGSTAFYSAGTVDEGLPAQGIYVSHDGGGSWQKANDATSQDANVTALAVDPRSAQTVYAATGNRGLLRSDDGGMSWRSLNLGIPSDAQVMAVALNPASPDTVLAGLGFGHGGLLRSDDGGQSWRQITAGLNTEAYVSTIVFDPRNPQNVYLADRFSGVYRSADGGQTWQPFNDGLAMRDVNKLAISADGAHLYAATEGGGVYRVDLNGTPPAGG